MDDPPLVQTFDERTDDSIDVDLARLGELMGAVLRAEGVPASAQAVLTLVDSERIAELKSEFLDGDGSPTDVLSFPIDGPEIASALAEAETREAVAGVSGGPTAVALGSSPDGPLLVGDVVLCPRVAADQASEHAGTTEDELALLVIHGSLHLLDWDHDEADAQSQMWARERELMTSLHRAPARDPWASHNQAEPESAKP
ncbi:MAG: rRNA maturation RNase YbeY [Microthrixaceae bacterium]